MSISEVEPIIEALTYGRGVKSPDPALQPFVPLDGDMLYIPCMLVISNQWARNMLSLHARTQSKTFDAQSSIFEQEMVGRLLEISKNYIVIDNRTFSSNGVSEEIDLLYCDDVARTLLVCELKWSIAPGDPREVVNRQHAIEGKVKQARRKASWVSVHAINVARQAGSLSPDGIWTVLPLVVIEGYSGKPSDTPSSVPVVQAEVFKVFLNKNVGISEIHSILATPLWLPRAGIDINIQHETVSLGGVEIHSRGYTVLRDSYVDETLPKYINDSLAYSEDERAAILW